MSVRTDTVQLIVNVNGNAAQNNLNNLKKRASDLTLEMKGLKKGTDEYIAKGKELATVDKEMEGLKKSIGLASLSQKELTAELRKLTALRGSVVPFSQEYKDLTKNIEQVRHRLAEVKSGTESFSNKLGGLGTAVKSFGVLAASYLGFQFITTQFQNIIGGAAKLSDQLADLRRVAGLTAGEANNLNKQLLDLDTRTNGEGLRKIAIIAGKLGVAKEDIFGFTKAVDQLVVTLGDELGDADQITTSLGKILNVFDGNINGDNISKLGNAFVELANTGAATGSFIADFDQRLAGVAKSAGISLGALSGLGAGLEEMGGNVEASSSAIQRIIINISKDLPAAAKIAGLSAKDFTKLFKEDATEALLKYSEGLVKNKESFSAVTAAMDDAGEAGVHTVATLNILGNSADKLRGRIDLGKESIERTAASTEAFRLQNETFGSTLDKLGKQFEKFVTNSGLSNFFKGLVENVIGLITPTKTLTDQWREQAAVVNSLEKITIPLIDRYEELKGKASLNKDEQKELNNTIVAIGNTIPTAISQFDKYGNALDINAKKAREFIDLQQAILKERNRSAIADEKSKLADLEKELKMRQAQLTGLQVAGAKETATLSELRKNIPGFTPDPGFQKNLDYYSKSIVLTAERVQALQERLTGVKGIIGELDGSSLKNAVENKATTGTTATTTTPTNTNTKTSTATGESDAKSQQKKYDDLKEQADKFYKELQLLKENVSLKDLDGQQKEVETITIKYRELLEKAQKYYTDLAKFGKADKAQLNKEEILIEEAFQMEIASIGKKFADIKKADEQRRNDSNYKSALASQKEINQQAVQQLKQQYIDGQISKKEYEEKLVELARNARANEITVAENWAKKSKAAAKDVVDFKRTQEQEITDATIEGIETRALAEEEAKKKADEDRKNHIDELTNEILDWANQLTEGLNSINQIANNRENAQFNREKALNEKKKKSFKDQLNNRLISQAQYDLKMQTLAEEQDRKERELRRKQAKREKALQIFGAVINTAGAVVKALNTFPAPNFVLGALAAISGGLQIAAIASAPLPELASGDWIRTGDKHSDPSGGINAKIERDEAVISARAMTNQSRYTVTGTTAQITSALNSRAGGASWAAGAVVQMPKWMTDQPKTLNPNMPRIMAQGGVASPVNNNIDINNNGEIAASLIRINQLLQEQINVTKEKQEKLHAVVSIKEYRQQEKLFDQAKKVSGLS